jgi:methyl-accepting chemotaxis protein
MNAKALLTVLFALAAAFGINWPAFSQQSPPQSDKASQIVALVENAAALIASKGKTVFPELRKSSSSLLGANTSLLFVDDKNQTSMEAFHYHLSATCLFVGDMKGVLLLNPGFPRMEGVKTLDITDSNGKRIYVAFMQMVQSNGSGWIDYMWPKLHEDKPSQKWTYVKAITVDGAPAYLGAGFYPQ